MSDDKQMPGEPEAVGYGKPPKESQFRKGQSGNPNGRPKGRRNVTTSLQAALNERVTITENGKRKSISKLDAAMKQVVNRAAGGDSASMRTLIQLFPLLDLQLDESRTLVIDPIADKELALNFIKRAAKYVGPISEDKGDTE